MSRDWHALLNRLLFGLTITFSLWSFIDLIVWTSVQSDLVLFLWSFFGIITAVLSLLSVYFTYVFVYRTDAPLWYHMTFAILLLPVIILTPTIYNLAGFDLELCGSSGFENTWFVSYYTLLGIIAIVWSAYLLIDGYWHGTEARRKEFVFMGIGIEFFLISFFTANFLASYLNETGVIQDYSLEQYGLLSMTVFMGFIALLIVRFQAFNGKVFAARALVLALVLLIGSEFFVVTTIANQLLVGVTLVIAILFGWLLQRSVDAEIQQRITIQAQEQELEKINAQQVNLLHFISHEIKGNLNKAQGVFAGMLEGDYGQLSPQLSTIAKGSLDDVRGGIAMVMDILDASNLRKGSVSYDKKPFDIRHTVLATTDAVRNVAMARGLQVEVITPPSGALTINGDEAKIEKHVIRNLVDNAIHYTQEGFVRVSIHAAHNTVQFAVEDSGVGITPEDMAHLFTEGGKGKESTKVNVNSTGYGLFIAKQVVEAHGGSIRAESEGAGKGSRFVVELPLA